MSEPTDLVVTPAYTRQAGEQYLAGVEAQKSELEAAIADARARCRRALDVERRIAALEHKVGEWIVTAHAEADPRYVAPSAGGAHCAGTCPVDAPMEADGG